MNRLNYNMHCNITMENKGLILNQAMIFCIIYNWLFNLIGFSGPVEPKFYPIEPKCSHVANIFISSLVGSIVFIWSKIFAISKVFKIKLLYWRKVYNIKNISSNYDRYSVVQTGNRKKFRCFSNFILKVGYVNTTIC